ncbi:MAG: hypothetical protein O3C61_07515 [Proteobacteria bacterium]|nr:hypothetical protein [Pseudomonadota bacterium]
MKKSNDSRAIKYAKYTWLAVAAMSIINFLLNPTSDQFFSSLVVGVFGGALFAAVPYLFIKFLVKSK